MERRWCSGGKTGFKVIGEGITYRGVIREGVRVKLKVRIVVVKGVGIGVVISHAGSGSGS